MKVIYIFMAGHCRHFSNNGLMVLILSMVEMQDIMLLMKEYSRHCLKVLVIGSRFKNIVESIIHIIIKNFAPICLY